MLKRTILKMRYFRKAENDDKFLTMTHFSHAETDDFDLLSTIFL
jgi:hypothetical protein